MKVINLSEYNENMGILIDVRHPLDYKNGHDPRSINIYADTLLFNHSKYLNKEDVYYITCKSGYLSKKVVSNLIYLGYNVIQVLS